MTKEERRQLKQRQLARDLVCVADELRRTRQRLTGTMNATRPDLHGIYAFRQLQLQGLEWQPDLGRCASAVGPDVGVADVLAAGRSALDFLSQLLRGTPVALALPP
jgi:hypothetical protein